MMLNGNEMVIGGETARSWRAAAEESGAETNELRVMAILSAYPEADPLQVSRFVGYAFPLVVPPPESTGLVSMAMRGDLSMESQMMMMPGDLVEWITNFRQGTEQERWTPAHAAECFATACGGNVRVAGNIFTWNGKQWTSKNENAALTDWLDHFMKIYGYAAAMDSPKLAKAIFYASFLNGTATYVAAKKEMRAEVMDFDRDTWLLNTPDGIVDLTSGETMPHDRTKLMTKMTRVGAMPREEFELRFAGSRFCRFLNEVFEEKQGLIDWLQQMIGYSITGDVAIHAMQFWTGTGRNGKSTLGELIMAMMGSYAAKVPNKLLAATKHERHPTEIAMLQGLRIAVASEVSSNEFFDVEKIKELTGDEILTARFMRKDFFQFQRTHKFIIYGNSNPRISNADPAFAARLKVVKFMRNFQAEGKMEGTLPKILAMEMPLVLRWAVIGAQKVWAAGKKIDDCEEIHAWTAGYMNEHDSVSNWWRDMVTVVPPEGIERKIKTRGEMREVTLRQENIVTAVNAMYNSYVSYTKENGYTTLGRPKFHLKFDELMIEAGLFHERRGAWVFEAKSRRLDGIRRKWARGVMLSPQDPVIEKEKRQSGRDDARSAKVLQYQPWFYGSKEQYGIERENGENAMGDIFEELEF